MCAGSDTAHDNQLCFDSCERNSTDPQQTTIHNLLQLDEARRRKSVRRPWRAAA